jgi:hypothetical protein
MQYAHLGYVYGLTLAQIQAYNTTTNKAIVDILYVPSDAPKRWFVGNADGSVRELFLTDNYVKSHEATATVKHTVDANGKLTSDVKISEAPNNTLSQNLDGLFVNVPTAFLTAKEDTSSIALTSTGGILTASVKFSADADNIVGGHADGIYAPDFSIHPDSVSFLEKIGRNIRVKQLLIKDVKVVTESDITAAGNSSTWLGDNLENYQEGDMAIMPSENTAWVKSATGWEQVKMPNMTQAQILAYLHAGAFVTIGTDGTIAVKVSQDAGNNIKAGADGGLFVDVDQTLSNAGGADKTINQHLIDLYGGVATATKTFVNGITEDAGVVKLGGVLIGNTVLTTGAFNLSVDGMFKTNNFNIADQNGDYFRVQYDSVRRVLFVEYPN